MKEKTVYICSNCGQDSPKWIGKCPSCGEWNTYVEEVVRKPAAGTRPLSGLEPVKSKPVILSEITGGDEPRIDMHDEELNRPPWCYKPYSVYRRNVSSTYPAKKAPGS